MKAGILIFLALLLSCGEKRQVSGNPPAPTNDLTLAAAQLTLAKNHLTNHSPRKAIPYLVASLTNNPSPLTQEILLEILGKTDFTLPFIELRHPFPILRFKESGGNLFVAIGGENPTVVRWSLGEEPTVAAVLFPSRAQQISQLTLSQNSEFIIIHRDHTNLLCHADTLKPIAALEPFADDLNPETCQPFSENGLLLANPTKDTHGFHIWHIHDSNTGQILRSEALPSYSPHSIATSASFQETTLQISMSDGSVLKIPFIGDTVWQRTSPLKIPDSPHTSKITHISETTLAINRTVRLNPDKIPDSPDTLLSALSGYTLDPITQTLSEIPIPNRLEILSAHFPQAIPPTLKIFSAAPPVARRLADAYPEIFPELTTEARSHADLIRQVFATGDHQAILAVIDSATHGLPLATALYLAIESQDPELISHALEKSNDIPPALRSLAKRESSADTDFSILRTIEDWHGYESPDFSPLLNRSLSNRSNTLAALTLPENPTEDEISAFSLRLTSPATLETLGKPLVAEKAIAAARTLSEIPEHAAAAIRLSDLAQNLGTHPTSSLRVRATALTTLSDFDAAHAAWIDLITHQPEDTHLPSDYTEAAYTAFETGNAPQAIEILNTGLFRFPNAPSSAIRSAWIALLTDHNDDALRYLNHAAKLGLPPDEIETTTALFAITHNKLGDPKMAASHHAQLIAISPKWNIPENIDSLPWPDSFKQSLREIISGEAETEPWPSPENDPTDTAPLPTEFPIEEPPLPSR